MSSNWSQTEQWPLQISFHYDKKIPFPFLLAQGIARRKSKQMHKNRKGTSLGGSNITAKQAVDLFSVRKTGDFLLLRTSAWLAFSVWRLVCSSTTDEAVFFFSESTLPPGQVVEVKVGMHCERCIKAIRKAIKKIEDIESYKFDVALNKITVTGNVTDEEVFRVLHKIGKHPTYWTDQ
ncbi:hypothetical protein H6P81_016796 [Aristolochia fimbriata]|uniref:HMA domain-containing protein n=1 Tax=Aristolochia fimbriata TaxID=158543 RepID=A0AAV7ECF5_ARIFI|nr:hypothetical protein H6P81_016796 [Aristolochia fimbriata]